MYSRVWVFRRYKTVTDPQTGEKTRVLKSKSWFIGWYDPEGHRRCRSCGPSKKAAERQKREMEAHLVTGLYAPVQTIKWEDFRAEYETQVLSNKAAATQDAERGTMDVFTAISRPKKMAGINSHTIDRFVAARKAGKPYGRHVSVATINHDLRNLRVILRTARRWKYIEEAPEFTSLSEPRRTPRTIADTDFDGLLAAADDW